MQSMTGTMEQRPPHSARRNSANICLFATVAILPLFFLLVMSPVAEAIVLQANSPTNSPQQPIVAAVPALNDSLRPALDQVGSALNQVQIDRWKLSRELKEELRGDANSIQQDLSAQLPALFQTAQQSPAQLGPQLGVMHNVDALYDVLVRITMAATIAGGKRDAAILDSAVQRLESARKTAAGQLSQAASMRDTQIARFQAIARAAQPTEGSPNGHPKTIVVNNWTSRHTSHHKAPLHHKIPPPASGGTPGAAAPPSH